MVRIVICDDEPMALDVNHKLCRRVCDKYGIDAEIKKYSSGNDLMFDLENPAFHKQLDILLLDVHMPVLNGIQVAEEIRKLGYAGVIIFVTASADYFRDAFDVHAFHYIVKGENFEKFEGILMDAINLSRKNSADEIYLSSHNEVLKLDVKTIDYFEVVKRIITVYYEDGEFSFNGNFSKIEEQLKDQRFIRIHRNYLVSLTHIKSISFKEVIINDGSLLPVGRIYYSALKEAFNKLKLQ